MTATVDPSFEAQAWVVFCQVPEFPCQFVFLVCQVQVSMIKAGFLSASKLIPVRVDRVPVSFFSVLLSLSLTLTLTLTHTLSTLQGRCRRPYPGR